MQGDDGDNFYCIDVGVVEVFLHGYLPESIAPYREAISLSIIIGLLVLRPDGLWPAPNVSRS